VLFFLRYHLAQRAVSLQAKRKRNLAGRPGAASDEAYDAWREENKFLPTYAISARVYCLSTASFDPCRYLIERQKLFLAKCHSAVEAAPSRPARRHKHSGRKNFLPLRIDF